MRFDLQFFAQERTEPATPRKRRKEREQGRVAKSQDLGAAVVILTGLFSLLVFGRFMHSYMRSLLIDLVAFMGGETIREAGWLRVLSREVLPAILLPWLPLGLTTAIGALLVTTAQVGIEITPKPLIPNMGRFNPVSGLKKVLSLRSVMELLKGLLKASLFALVIYFAMKKDMPELVAAIRMPLPDGVALLFSKLLGLCFRLAFLLLVIALFDYAYQKWEFEKSIKMSKQELKEEYKQMEGDPQIKSKIRQKQRELARSRMMSSVPKADVVITNPTRLAVALEYDREIMEAPVIVAKGSGFVADKIRALAEEHGVPIVENRPLAWSLFESLEVGDEIPEHLYRAVAEVLAFIYKLKGGGRKKPAVPVSGTRADGAPESGLFM
ncbi:MAG: flagellar biosynthesis protein FlhB [Synergistaceae bacterium]|nr:flagellar biosynthesis protein FlhB [Synergistota bacterium]NLM70860.1 flagellar biosynthesis protein FlhB [Synergistaceae bacterium]